MERYRNGSPPIMSPASQPNRSGRPGRPGRMGSRPGARWRAGVRAGGWAVVVAIALWSPGGGAPSRWPWSEWLRALSEAGADKLVHAALFAVQAWLLCGSRRGGWRWFATCFTLASGYGVVTELGQLHVPGRDAGVADALANAAGAAVGVALYARSGRSRSGPVPGGGRSNR